MNCTNCKDRICNESYWFLRGTEKMTLCDNCGGDFYNGIFEKEGWQRLTEKQIARIERIRAERAERIVDQRDSPNVAPYKKCAFCHERSSCGNYTDDDQWQCESCAPDEEPMKISNLSSRNLDTLQEGLIIIHAMKINEDYLECIKAIMGLMELFEGDAGFYKLLVDLRDETKNLWRKKLDKNKKRK